MCFLNPPLEPEQYRPPPAPTSERHQASPETRGDQHHAPFARRGQTARIQNTDIEAFEEKSRLSVIEETVTIGELVRALNAMGTTPTDLISIIQAIKASGAMAADVEMM